MALCNYFYWIKLWLHYCICLGKIKRESDWCTPVCLLKPFTWNSDITKLCLFPKLKKILIPQNYEYMSLTSLPSNNAGKATNSSRIQSRLRLVRQWKVTHLAKIQTWACRFNMKLQLPITSVNSHHNLILKVNVTVGSCTNFQKVVGYSDDLLNWSMLNIVYYTYFDLFKLIKLIQIFKIL